MNTCVGGFAVDRKRGDEVIVGSRERYGDVQEVNGVTSFF